MRVEQNRYLGRVVPLGDPTATVSLLEPAGALRSRGRPGTDEEEEQTITSDHEHEAWTNLGRS